MPKVSDHARARVLAMLRETPPRGYRDIAEKTGVGLGTITRIAQTAGIESARAAQTEAATHAAGEAHRRRWAERRADLIDDLGEVVAELLQKARTAAARDAQSLMTAVAIGVDKAQLLSGGATSRHEQLGLERQRERILAMGDELADRRAAKDGTTGG